MVSSLLSLAALGWAAVLLYWVVASRKKAQARVAELEHSGFTVDFAFRGNVYVLFDHRRKKIAFVFRDKSLIHDYGDIQGITRYWLDFPGLKLQNTMVFALRDKKIRCRNLSARHAEYWHHRSVELLTA